MWASLWAHKTLTSSFWNVEPLGTPLGTYGNSKRNLGNFMGTFKSHTNALIRWDELSTPSSCKHWFFIRLNFICRKKNNLSCLSGFVDCRMGIREWMAWMWSTHDHTPSIHNASVTWDPSSHLCWLMSLKWLSYFWALNTTQIWMS